MHTNKLLLGSLPLFAVRLPAALPALWAQSSGRWLK